MIEYELLEIPKTLWRAIGDIRVEDFAPLTKAGSTSVPVKVDGRTVYTLSFDGSDQKIQVRNLSVEHCITHGHWLLRSP